MPSSCSYVTRNAQLPFGTPGREETCISTPLALLFMGFSLLLYKLLKY